MFTGLLRHYYELLFLLVTEKSKFDIIFIEISEVSVWTTLQHNSETKV